MAKKSVELRDIFVKLTTVFPKDLFIVDSGFAIAGPDSDDEIRGIYVVKFYEEYTAMLKDFFGSQKVVYIPSIRAFKDDMTKYKEYPETSKTFVDKMDFCNKFMSDIMMDFCGWEPFDISDDMAKRIFVEKEMVEMFADPDSGQEPIICGRNIFPLLTEKTINEAQYKYVDDADSGLKQFTVQFEHTYFHTWLKYAILPLSGDSR